MISRLVEVFRASPVPVAAGRIAVPRPEPIVAAPQGVARTGSRTMLGNIQVLRGVAAVAVLISHVSLYTRTMRGSAQATWRLDELSGQMGVAVFFAISGFLMAGLVARGDPWRFLAHRVSRIFPTYYAVVAIFAPVFAVLGLGLSVNLAALTLAPVGPRTYPFSVEWTLVFETSFYVGLFLLAWAGWVSRLVPAAAGWLVLAAVAWFVVPRSTMDAAPYLLPFAPACAAFAGGLLLPRLIERGRIRPAFAWLALPLLVAAVAFDIDARRWLGGAAAVLLVGAAVCSRQATANNRFGKAAITFGDWSYVLYLVHVPIIILVLRYAPASWPDPVLWLSGAVAALGATALFGPLDMLLYRRLRRGIDAASPLRIRQGVAVYLAIFFGFAVSASVDFAGNAWREGNARDTLAALPGPSWASAASAEAVIAARDIGLPGSVHGGIEGFSRVSPKDFILGAWAFDSEKPRRQLILAAFCGGQLVGLDRPSRLRPNLVTLPGFEASRGRRIGYRLRVPDGACVTGETPVAVLIGAEGRLAVLSNTGQPVAVSEAR